MLILAPISAPVASNSKDSDCSAVVWWIVAETDPTETPKVSPSRSPPIVMDPSFPWSRSNSVLMSSALISIERYSVSYESETEPTETDAGIAVPSSDWVSPNSTLTSSADAAPIPGMDMDSDSAEMNAGPSPEMSVMDMAPAARSAVMRISALISVQSELRLENGNWISGYSADMTDVGRVPADSGISMRTDTSNEVSVIDTLPSISLEGPPTVTPSNIVILPPSLMSIETIMSAGSVRSMTRSMVPSNPTSVLSATR